MTALEWFPQDEADFAVEFDSTVLFSAGYDFDGLESRAWVARDHAASYIVWPSSGRWSAYQTSDGGLWFERFASREAAMSVVGQ